MLLRIDAGEPLHSCDLPVGFEFRLVRDSAAFSALAEPWEELVRSSARPAHLFQSHPWLMAWCRHYHCGSEFLRSAELAVGTIWRERRLVLAVPFIAVSQPGLTTLQWMGLPVSQYGDAVVADANEHASLAAVRPR